jgi:beta-mannosidase
MKCSSILVWLSGFVLIDFYSNASSQPSPRRIVEINRNWQFRQADKTDWLPATVPGTVHTDLYQNQRIDDPFFRTNEKGLQWIDKVNWEYRTIIEADDELLARDRIELVFKGLDTYAEVFLNDSLLLNADNMFREWRKECKSYLKKGTNTLRILLRSPVEVDIPKLERLGYSLPAVNDQSENGGLGDRRISVFARKAGYHYGWDWGPRFVTSGIWRPVYLEAWDRSKIVNLYIKQKSVSEKKALLTATFEIQSIKAQRARLSLFDDETSNELAKTETQLSPDLNTVTINFEIENPRLWWTNGLGEANVYHFSGRLDVGSTILDEVKTNTGIRTLRLIQKEEPSGRSFYFELNGVPVFMKGANYIPNDNFLPSVTAQEYEEVIQAAVDANFNMLRVWGGGIYENDLFYDLCDQHGILVWQDFMFACAMYPGDSAFVENVTQEAVQNVKRLRNHACIALWCGNNEIDAAWGYNTSGGWGWKERYSKELQDKIWNDYTKIFHHILPNIVDEYHDEIDYWPSSPMAGPNERASYKATSGDIHYWGVWHGQEPFESYKRTIGRFMSEYGFQSFPEFETVKSYTKPEDWDIRSEVMDAHQRSGIGNERIKTYMGWYYRIPKDFESFLYMSQILQAEGIKTAIEAHRRKRPYCMGTLYWQLNDCWPVASWSSIDYYRRWKALHYFVRKAYQEIIVTPVEEDGVLCTWIVSDRLESTDAKLDMALMDLCGNVVAESEIEVTIEANSSQCYFQKHIRELLDGMDKKDVVFATLVSEGEETLSSNLYYFVPIKEIDLPVPNITKSIVTTMNGYSIELETDKLAKNIFMDVEGSEGFFSDNYFDLIPGKTSIIYYNTNDEIPDIEKRLKIMSVVDSYSSN